MAQPIDALPLKHRPQPIRAATSPPWPRHDAREPPRAVRRARASLRIGTAARRRRAASRRLSRRSGPARATSRCSRAHEHRESRTTEREGESAAIDANKEIAQALFVSRKTVEMHLGHAYRKLDIHSRAELPEVLQAKAQGAAHA